jgi:hypothetical protein
MGPLEDTSAEPVVRLRPGAVARCTQRDRIRVWRFLAEPVIACVRGFTSALAFAYFAGLRPYPGEIRCVAFRPTLLSLRGLAKRFAEHFAGKVFAELEIGKHGGWAARSLGYGDATCDLARSL